MYTTFEMQKAQLSHAVGARGNLASSGLYFLEMLLDDCIVYVQKALRTEWCLRQSSVQFPLDQIETQN